MIVARQMLADRRRGLAWWTVGIVALVAFTVVLFPTIRDNADFDRLTRDLPTAMRDLLSFDDAVPLTSAPGYLQGRLFGSLLVVLFVVFAIGTGARGVAGSEEDGTLELLLMNPVQRRTVVIERYLGFLVLVAVLTLVTFVAVTALSAPFGALDGVSIGGLAGACAGVGLLAFLHGTIAFTVGAATGRRSVALAVATVIAVAGYLVQGLAGVASALDPVQPLSPWHWYLDENMLAHGIDARAVLLPAIAAPAVFAPAVALFSRRDLR